MISLIIRDDDINYFTPEWVLEKVYRKCWENNIPIALSVIPSLLSQKGYYLDYHPFIPQEHTSIPKYYNIDHNTSLCNYLNKQIKDNLIEICLHGFDHSLTDRMPEFFIKDRTKIRQKIMAGRNILKKGIPLAKVETFIPPFDRISARGLEVITEEGMNISLNISIANCTFFHILPIKGQFSIWKDILCGLRQTTVTKVKSSKIFFHCGYEVRHLYRKRTNRNGYDLLIKSIEQNIDKDKVFVIVNHHWEFFDRGYRHQTRLFKQWSEFLDNLLLYKKDIYFTTFEKCEI